MSEISQPQVPQKAPPRLRHSNLFITLNTNDNMLGDDEQTHKTKIDKLRHIVRAIFTEDFIQK